MIMNSDIKKLICILFVHISSIILENFKDHALIIPELLKFIELHTYKFGLVYNFFQNFTHFLAVNYQGAIYCNCTGWYVSHLVRNIKYRLSHDRAAIMNSDSM